MRVGPFVMGKAYTSINVHAYVASAVPVLIGVKRERGLCLFLLLVTLPFLCLAFPILLALLLFQLPLYRLFLSFQLLVLGAAAKGVSTSISQCLRASIICRWALPPRDHAQARARLVHTVTSPTVAFCSFSSTSFSTVAENLLAPPRIRLVA